MGESVSQMEYPVFHEMIDGCSNSKHALTKNCVFPSNHKPHQTNTNSAIRFRDCNENEALLQSPQHTMRLYNRNYLSINENKWFKPESDITEYNYVEPFEIDKAQCTEVIACKVHLQNNNVY